MWVTYLYALHLVIIDMCHIGNLTRLNFKIHRYVTNVSNHTNVKLLIFQMSAHVNITKRYEAIAISSNTNFWGSVVIGQF